MIWYHNVHLISTFTHNIVYPDHFQGAIHALGCIFLSFLRYQLKKSQDCSNKTFSQCWFSVCASRRSSQLQANVVIPVWVSSFEKQSQIPQTNIIDGSIYEEDSISKQNQASLQVDLLSCQRLRPIYNWKWYNDSAGVSLLTDNNCMVLSKRS